MPSDTQGYHESPELQEIDKAWLLYAHMDEENNQGTSKANEREEENVTCREQLVF